jgi:hypothetical protein
MNLNVTDVYQTNFNSYNYLNHDGTVIDILERKYHFPILLYITNS